MLALDVSRSLDLFRFFLCYAKIIPDSLISYFCHAGSIPDTHGALAEVKVLDLSHNALSGEKRMELASIL